MTCTTLRNDITTNFKCSKQSRRKLSKSYGCAVLEYFFLLPKLACPTRMVKSAVRVNLIVEREKECEGEGKIWNSDQMHMHTYCTPCRRMPSFWFSCAMLRKTPKDCFREKTIFSRHSHSLPQNTFHSLSKRIIGIN